MIIVRFCAAIALVALVALAACVNQFTLAGPGPLASAGGLNLSTGMAWNRQSPSELAMSSAAPLELWTQDGVVLQHMLVFGGVPDGQALFKKYQEIGEFPAFRASMGPQEIVELVEATLGKMWGTTLIQAQDLRPAKVAGLDGVHFGLRAGREEVESPRSVNPLDNNEA